MSKQIGQKETKVTNRISLDDVLKPGQKVRIVRNVDIAFDVDIREYLDESGDSDESEITVETLQRDIEYNFDITEILDQWDDVEVTDVSVVVTEIH